MYTLIDPPLTDAPQPDSTQLPTQGQDDQSDKPTNKSEWKMEDEEGMHSDFQKQPEQPPRDEVDHLGTPKTDSNLASLSEHKPSTDSHQDEKLASRVASQRIDADQNQKTGNDTPSTTATKAPPSSGSAQHDGHDHHHRDRVRMDPRRDPNLLGIDMYSIYLRSIGIRPLASPSFSGGDGKRPNVNIASDAMNSQPPLKDEWKLGPEIDKIIEGRIQSDAVQLDNPSGALPAGVDDKTPPTKDDAPPSAGVKDKTPPTEDDAPAGIDDKTPPIEDDAPPSDTPPDNKTLPIEDDTPAGVKDKTPPTEDDAPAGIDDKTPPTEDDAPPSAGVTDKTPPTEDDAPAGIDNKTPPIEGDTPPSDTPSDNKTHPIEDDAPAGVKDKTPPTKNDAPPSDAPVAGIDDKTQDDASLEDSPDDKTCSTEDEAVQPPDLDNATSPSKEAPPSTRREVPPPSLRDGEQEEEEEEEGKHEPESNIPDVIADRKYYSPDNVSSTYSIHVPYCSRWVENSCIV